MPDIQFILEDQFQELLVAKPVGRGFLRIPTQTGHQSDLKSDRVPIQSGQCSD
jgi:hypothetical protein